MVHCTIAMMSQCTVASKFKIKCEYTDQNHTLYNEQDNLECKYIVSVRLLGRTPGDQVLSLPSGKNWFDFVLFSNTFVPTRTRFATLYAWFVDILTQDQFSCDQLPHDQLSQDQLFMKSTAMRSTFIKSTLTKSTYKI